MNIPGDVRVFAADASEQVFEQPPAPARSPGEASQYTLRFRPTLALNRPASSGDHPGGAYGPSRQSSRFRTGYERGIAAAPAGFHKTRPSGPVAEITGKPQAQERVPVGRIAIETAQCSLEILGREPVRFEHVKRRLVLSLCAEPGSLTPECRAVAKREVEDERGEAMASCEIDRPLETPGRVAGQPENHVHHSGYAAIIE